MQVALTEPRWLQGALSRSQALMPAAGEGGSTNPFRGSPAALRADCEALVGCWHGWKMHQQVQGTNPSQQQLHRPNSPLQP